MGLFNIFRAFLVALSFIFLMASCGGERKSGPEALKTEIKQLEDSIMSAQEKGKTTANYSLPAQKRLIEKLEQFHRDYPENEYDQESLTKLHMAYSAIGENKRSAAWGDTLLNNYKDFPNRPIVIQSQILAYDEMIKPRDKSMVKKYIEMYIKENPESEETPALKERLLNLDMTFEEWLNHKLSQGENPIL